MDSIEILLSIMPEEHWRLMEEASLWQERGDWLTAEVCRKQAGYDVLAIDRWQP
jgi:hypothetical protein